VLGPGGLPNGDTHCLSLLPAITGARFGGHFLFQRPEINLNQATRFRRAT
jgi:hypothetical protein